MSDADEPVVLFDGVCNFCNASVHFIIDREPAGRIRFASLQSEVGQALLQKYALPINELSTMVFIEGGRAYTRSTAGLRIARRLKWPWPVLYGLIVIPALIRNAVYNLIARNRYQWFGKTEQCRLPDPALRARFLDIPDSSTADAAQPVAHTP